MRLSHLWITAFVAVILSQTTIAQTEVGGDITSDTAWTAAGNPYIVVDTVRVLEGVTLSIEPGVRVKFDTAHSLEVAGILVARGTATDSVTFTSNAPSPQPGDWGSIKFDSTSVDAVFDSLGNYLSGSIIECCRIEYGGEEGGICCDRASPFIHQNLITANAVSGISCYGSSPKIEGNRIEGNADSLTDYGGGIFCASSSPTITENLICGNSAQYGGGVFCYGESYPRILDNTIVENWALRGGGICCFYYPKASALISGNDIRGNTAADLGGGIYTYGTMAWDINTNNIIGNSAANGGGIYCFNSSRLMNIAHNIISHNFASDNGGGLFCNSSAPTISDNSIIGNSASTYGGGIYTSGVSHYHFPLSITQNNITGNLATLCGGIYSADSSYLVMDYNNLVNMGQYEVYLNGVSEDVNAINNWWGTTNLDSIEAKIYDYCDDTTLAEVHFNPFLTLPVIGNPASVYSLRLKSDSTYSNDLTTDLWIGAEMYIQLEGTDSDSLSCDQTTVTLKGNLTDTTGIQVILTETDTTSGIFRGTARIDSISIEDLSIEAVVGETLTVISNIDSTQFVTVLVGKEGIKEGNISPIPKEIALFQNYPNPFNVTTLIRYHLSAVRGRPTAVTLKVYNLLGQEVITLVDKEQKPGKYEVSWDGRNRSVEEVASGIYFYRLSARDFHQARKLVILK